MEKEFTDLRNNEWTNLLINGSLSTGAAKTRECETKLKLLKQL